MTEDQLEQETLDWLKDVGYTHLYSPDIAYDGTAPSGRLAPVRHHDLLNSPSDAGCNIRELTLKDLQPINIAVSTHVFLHMQGLQFGLEIQV